MADFTSTAPLNMRWNVRGRTVDIVSNARSGIPLAAGATFSVPDDLADEFEAVHGDQVTVRRYPTYPTGEWTTETTLALIPGLTRL